MVLPTAWETLDFDPATNQTSVVDMVRRTVGGQDSLAVLRRWATERYRQILDDGASAGLFFGATYADDMAGIALSASVLAFLRPVPLDAEGQVMAPGEVARALSGPDDDEERTVEPPRLVQLPVGLSVRTRGRVTGLPGPTGHAAEVEMVRFFCPVPAWDLMLVIVFSTPVLSAAAAFCEVFDTIAATATWKR